MSNLSRSLTLAAAAVLASPAALRTAAAIPIGDVGEIFVTAGASVRWDDNIFLTERNEDSDLVMTFSPGVEFRLGSGNDPTKVSLGFREDLIAYVDNTEQNAQLANLFLRGTHTGPKTSFSGNATFQQLNQNDRSNVAGVDNFVDREILRADLSMETQMTAKTSLGVGLGYDEVNYREPPPFNDNNSVTVPVNVYYRFRPKLDLSGGIRYRTTDGSLPGTGGDSLFYNVGARGELTPKLQADLRVGIETRDPESGDDSSTFAMDGTLTWLAGPRSTVEFSMGRRFDVSALGTDIERTDLVVTVNHQLSQVLSATGSVSYQNANYVTGRDDDYYVGEVGVTYQYSEYVGMTAGYTYRTNSSNQPLVEFSNNVVSLAASFRY